MTIASMPEAVFSDAFLPAARETSEPGRAVSTLITWWNGMRDVGSSRADHLAAYIATPEGGWRNALWEDPTEYRLSCLDEARSSARLGGVIVEFRVLRIVDGQSRSSPAEALESYLLVKPDDAWAWSIQAVEEVRRHVGHRTSAAVAAGLAACRRGSKAIAHRRR